MDDDHYFSAKPASADERRAITVTLAGHVVQVETAAGVFSGAHIDLGTQVLLKRVPRPRAGTLLDVGCGWGPLALAAALMEPACTVTAVDVNERALDLMRRNAASLAATHSLAPITACTPDDVPPTDRFDTIWSNPPIRIGKEALHGLLARWMPMLTPGGVAYLVVQRNLGADSLATWMSQQRDAADEPWGTVSKLASAKGFRVLEVVRDGAARG